MWSRNGRWILLEMPDFHVAFRNLLHAVNLRHGTDGFTSPPKEGVLRIFSPWKNRRLRPGLNPRTWVPKAIRLPLDYRRRLLWCQLQCQDEEILKWTKRLILLRPLWGSNEGSLRTLTAHVRTVKCTTTFNIKFSMYREQKSYCIPAINIEIIPICNMRYSLLNSGVHSFIKIWFIDDCKFHSTLLFIPLS